MDEDLDPGVDVGVEVDTHFERADLAYRLRYLNVPALDLTVEQIGQGVGNDGVGDRAVQPTTGPGTHGDVHPLAAQLLGELPHVLYRSKSPLFGLLLEAVYPLQGVAGCRHREPLRYEVVPRESSLDFLDLAPLGDSLHILQKHNLHWSSPS